MSKYELLQWKFTACQYNIEGSNGFNTFSMSEGLTADDKADLCRKAGSYTPPDGLPFTPTQEEIKTLFPVVFSSFPLSSGKHTVVRTVYVGQSYAEKRWGNFFSHALISPSDSLTFYPIQLFDSPLFENGLTPEELQINTIPPKLPPIEVDEEGLRDFSTELPLFFGDDPSRSKMLTLLLNAVRDGHQSGKPLILKDLPDSIPLWLAAIQYAFPLRLAGGITFTTYVHSLSHGERFHITTTPDGKTLQMDSATNHIFDFLNGMFPEISAKPSLFIKEIKCDEPQYPGRDMRTIQRFMETLRCSISGNSIEKAIVLYKFLEWNTPLSNQALRAVLDFCTQQDIAIKQQLALKILQKEQIYDADTLEMLLLEFMNVIQESKSNELKKLFLDFFVRQFENSIDPLGWADGDCRFEVIDRFLEKCGKGIGKELLEHVDRLVKQTGETEKKYICLGYALNLCLYSRNASRFCEEIEMLPLSKLEKHELEQFFNQALAFIISKSFSPLIHKHTVGLFTKKCGYTTSFAECYMGIVKQYGTGQWKHGKPAKEQGTAFAEYVFNDATEAEWDMWLGGWPPLGDLYHKTSFGKTFFTNPLWLLFDIDKSTQGTLGKKKNWGLLFNIHNMLKTLATSADKKKKERLKQMRFPTKWDAWSSIIKFCAIIAVSIILVGICLLFLYFMPHTQAKSEKSPAPTSQQQTDESAQKPELPEFAEKPESSDSTTNSP